MFRPDIPDELIAGYNSKEGHFALVNHQIMQIRDAMALAQALGRTLVLPRMVCGWDRWWAPHGGTIPHSSLQNPYVCPAVRTISPICTQRSHTHTLGLTELRTRRTTSLTSSNGFGSARRRNSVPKFRSGSTPSSATRVCQRRGAYATTPKPTSHARSHGG